MSEPLIPSHPKPDVERAAEPAERAAFNSDEARYEGADDEPLATPVRTDDQKADPSEAAYDGGYGGQEFGMEAGGEG